MAVVACRALILVVAVGWMGVGAGFGLGFGQADSAPNGQAQVGAAPSGVPVVAEEAKAEERPLPDIPALMQSVEINQRAAEAIEKDYLYRSVVTEDQLNGHGGVKKTETREFDVFWVEGVPVHRMTKKDGKELSAEEQKKENEQIDKEVAKAKERRAKVDAKGKESDARGDELMTASRALELGSFSNARRVVLNGRDTIAVDFAGDPKAKTKNRFEDVVKDLAGTAWVDEQDRMLVKAQGHFLNNFKIGGGLVANIQKGTSFGMEQRKVNGEVWLPAVWEGQGQARALLLFGFNGRVRGVQSDYRKFKATSTIVPVESTAEPETQPK
jgi:hypothetical protein